MRFFAFGWSIAVLPPMEASTCASTVVGSGTKLAPRMYVAATKPARSPTAPPPSARTVEVRSAPAASSRSQQCSATASVLAASPSGTSSTVTESPAASRLATTTWPCSLRMPASVTSAARALPALQTVLVGPVVAADLFDAVAAELLEEGVGEDDRHHGLAHDASRRHRADVAALHHRLHRFLGGEIHRLERRAQRRERLHGGAHDERLAVGHAALQAARVVGRAVEA